MKRLLSLAVLLLVFAAAPALAQSAPSSYDDMKIGPNQWIVSGVVGSDFSKAAVNSSIDFGGSIGYLWNGALGPEFVANFSPKFNLDKLGGAETRINSYMANAVIAAPMGWWGRVQPYASGGVGAMTLGLGAASNPDNFFESNQSHFAGNLGGGIMAFAGRVGVRGDVRYFRSIGANNNLTSSTGTSPSLLDNVAFWRADIGIAARW